MRDGSGPRALRRAPPAGSNPKPSRNQRSVSARSTTESAIWLRKGTKAMPRPVYICLTRSVTIGTRGRCPPLLTMHVRLCIVPDSRSPDVAYGGHVPRGFPAQTVLRRVEFFPVLKGNHESCKSSRGGVHSVRTDAASGTAGHGCTGLTERDRAHHSVSNGYRRIVRRRDRYPHGSG